MNDVLNNDFLNELFSCCFKDKRTMEICNQFLKKEYFVDEAYRLIWSEIKSQFNDVNFNKLPTLGSIKLKFSKSNKDVHLRVTEVLDEIKQTFVDDKDVVINSLQEFIKKSIFVKINEDIITAYNNSQIDKSYSLFQKGAEEFSNFSIKAKTFDKVFEDFNSRNFERVANRDNLYRKRWPFGIDEIDRQIPGIEQGEVMLWLGQSGVGKSFCLIHQSITIARRGGRVLHVQLEGTREQSLARFDSAWTGSLFFDVKSGDIEPNKLKKIQKVITNRGRGEIFVESFEKFGSSTMADIRNSAIEIVKNYGELNAIVIDYMDLSSPSDGHSYGPTEERFRQRKVGREFKSLCVELNSAGHTGTQGSSIRPEDLNNPDFVMTRYNLAEDKGKIEPFDLFATINQTFSEKRNKICRISFDKTREHTGSFVVKIHQALERSRFYNRQKTLQELEFENEGIDD